MAATIIAALVGVMSEIGAIAKNRKNPQQGYNFRGIDDIYNALQPALIKHGVVVIPTFATITREERPTKSGGVLIYTNVMGKFTFYHTDGSQVEAVAYGEGMDSSDKSTNKAMSAAFKYALLQTLCIPTEDHIDSERDTPEQKAPAPEKKPEPQPKADPPKTDQATDAQRKKLFAMCMGKWDNRDKAKSFADWLLDTVKAEHFSKDYISECIEDFNNLARLFEEEQNDK